MTRRFFAALLIPAALMAAGAALSPAHASAPRSTVALVGAGSTFDLPFFAKAFPIYQKHHAVSVTYDPVGSGAGITDFTNKTVDFGASDVPMDPATELKAAEKAGGPVEQVPITLGGVAMAYNLPGIKSGLHLTGPAIAKIYLGKIKNWNAPMLRKLNPRVHLPNLAITVAHRSDASGTSNIFTGYLSSVSKVWAKKIGVGKLPAWPVGVGGKGNPGVAAVVQQTPGGLGYVELAYVLQIHMTDALLQNRAHKWVYPTLKSVAAAAAQFPHVTATRYTIVNAKGPRSYPICGYSWVLLWRHQSDATKGRAVVALMRWMVTAGQTYAKSIEYVPLPKAVKELAQRDLTAITF